MANKVRMADIAQQLGISVVSVSKGLAGKDGVSEELRRRILAAAQELGYTAPTERNKEKRLTGNIGFLVADRFFADHTFYANVYRAMLKHCAASGFSGLLEIVSSEDEYKCTVPSIISNGKVDGLIFMGQLSRNYLQTMINFDIPYILLDFYYDSLSADSVISDNTSGEYILTNHLIGTGRRKIGFVGSIFATSSIMDRYLGYTKALLQAGLPLRSDWRLEDRDESGRFITLQLPDELPEAFVCSCDEVAYNLVEMLKRMGLRIPQDVAVAGYDDHLFSQISNPPLTTYRVNAKDMGRVAVDRIIRRINGKKPVAGDIVIHGTLIRRDST